MYAPDRRTLGLVGAFAAVYLVWGSTYYAILVAIETMPPFLMAAARFLAAGAVMYVALRAAGTPAPTRGQWRSATVVGGLLLLGGNAVVSWAEKRVPSGLTALIIAVIPIWMVLFAWARGGGAPIKRVGFGLALGFAGLALLVSPGEILGGGAVDALGAAAVVFATLCWAWGSVWSKTAEMPSSALLATAMQMLAGGGLTLVASALLGEWRGFDVAAVSARSWAAWAYLVVFGSIVAFSCYVWLLKTTTPARVATYAYVNPIVAVLVGWWLAGEALTPRVGVAAAVILGAVALITAQRAAPPGPGAGNRPRRGRWKPFGAPDQRNV